MKQAVPDPVKDAAKLLPEGLMPFSTFMDAISLPGTEPEYLLSTFGMDSDAGADAIYLTATAQVSESMTVTADDANRGVPGRAVLVITARPYTWWRIYLVAAMGVAFLLVLAVPWLQDFFALKLVGVTMPWVAVRIAVVAAATLELVWRWVDRRFPA